MSRKKDKARWATAIMSPDELFNMKKMALLREAGQAFRRKGFHNTSMDEVAAALNVTKPALYYYMKTKQEILFECHQFAFDLADQAKQTAWEASEIGIERLRILLEKYIELLTSTLGSCAVLLEPLSSLSPGHQKIVLKRFRDFDRLMKDLVQQAIDEKSIPPQDPRLTVGFFMGALLHITSWYDVEGARTGKEIAQAYGRFVLNGLKGGSPEPANSSDI